MLSTFKSIKSFIGLKSHSSYELANQITETKALPFKLEDILREDTDGEYKGCNALWHLARKHDYISIMEIWDIHKELIPLAAFTKEAVDEKHKGKSALWWLSQNKHKDIPSDFVAIWEHYHGIPLSVLIKDVGGTNILAQLLLHEKGTEKFFTLVWEKYAEDIPLECIKLLLLASAGNSLPVFKILWQACSSHISLADLIKPYFISGYESIFILWNLAFAYKENKPGALELIKDILINFPGRIPEACLTLSPIGDGSALYTLMEFLTLTDTTKFGRPTFDFKTLIETRNQFYLALEEKKIDLAFTHAAATTKAGHLNAFFELGETLLPTDLDKAVEAYLQIPTNSPHYHECNLRLANLCYTVATVPETSEVKRNQLIDYALSFAKKTGDEDRAILLQNIAFSYTTKGQQKGLGDEIKLWRPWWLEVMDNDTPNNWCLERFEEAAKEEILKKENSELKKEVTALRNEDKRKEAELKQLAIDNANLQKLLFSLMQEVKAPLLTTNLPVNREALVFSSRENNVQPPLSESNFPTDEKMPSSEKTVSPTSA